MIQTWEAVVNAPLPAAAGSPLASSTVLTDINALTTTNAVLFANQLVVGSALRLTAWGIFSNTGTPTLLLGFYYGGVAGIALGTSGAVTTASGVTNMPWRIEATGIVRSVGSSGSIHVNGVAYIGTAATTWAVSPMPTSAPQTAVTIDTTVAKAITVGGQWGANSASNTVTCHGFVVESMV